MAEPMRPTVHIPRAPGAPDFKLQASFDGPLDYTLELYRKAQEAGFSAELSASTSDRRATVEVSVNDGASWNFADALKRFQEFNDFAKTEFSRQE